MKLTRKQSSTIVMVAVPVLFVVVLLVRTAMSSTEDPRLGAARRITANIQRTEQRIAGEEAAAFRIIDEAINKLPDGTLQAQLDTLNGFRQATAVLHAMARDLLAHRDNLVTDLESLLEMTQHSVSVYNDAARCFQENAAEEPFDEIKEDYVTLANAWTAMAAFMDERGKRLAIENDEIRDTMQYLERTAIFLDRLKQNLDSLPDLQALQEREQYLEQLRRYIRSFEEFRSLFRKFNAALQSDVRPVTRQSDSSPAQPPRSEQAIPNSSQGDEGPSPPAVSPPTTTSESQRRPQSNQASLMYAFLPIFTVLFAMTIAAVQKREIARFLERTGIGLSFPTRFGVDIGTATPKNGPMLSHPSDRSLRWYLENFERRTS